MPAMLADGWIEIESLGFRKKEPWQVSEPVPVPQIWKNLVSC